jgi:hypothetical protein
MGRVGEPQRRREEGKKRANHRGTEGTEKKRERKREWE